MSEPNTRRDNTQCVNVPAEIAGTRGHIWLPIKRAVSAPSPYQLIVQLNIKSAIEEDDNDDVFLSADSSSAGSEKISESKRYT